MKSAIIVPTYNEAGNIGRLIEAISNLNIDAYIVVVDDNSPDGTAGIVEQLMTTNERVILVKRPAKLGLGTAYVAGFERMLPMPEVTYFLTMDADFSHHPKSIPDLINNAEGVDIVIGSRYVKGGKTVDFAFHRRLISRCANLFAKILLGLTPGDCTAGFRCYHRKVLETVPFDSIFSHGYSFLVEMLFRCQRRGYKVREVPITYVARSHGLSKISMNEIKYTAWTIIKLWLQYRIRVWRQN